MIFSLAYHPFVGGAEVAIKEIAERLGAYFEFDLITANLDGRQPAEENNFNGISRVYRLGAGKTDKYRFPWLAYGKALELQQKNGYDAVWAMMANQAGLAALKFKKKFPHIPYLLTLQEGDSGFDIWLRTWFMRPLYKAIYRRADRLQAISNFLAVRAKRLGAKCSIEVVPNGIDQLRITNYELRNNQVKKIITVSRLVKKNGIKYLIEALALFLKVNFGPIELQIVGDGKLRNQLEKRADDLQIAGQVKFLGSVSQSEVYKLLEQADVFVRPSLSEGLGNAFLEAMAMGVPVVGTRVGGIPDFLKDGETGWFCEVKNPKSITEKINYVLDEKNKAEVEKVVENAQKLVAEKYNWNRIAGEMKNIFNKLTNGQE